MLDLSRAVGTAASAAVLPEQSEEGTAVHADPPRGVPSAPARVGHATLEMHQH